MKHSEKVRTLLYGSHDPYENLDLLPVNNHGWASENPCYNDYISAIRPKLIVEVGTWMGGSARAFTRHCLENSINDFEVVCVDTFLGSVEHWNRSSYLMTFKNGRPTVYDQFLSNTVHAGYQKYITPFPIDSQNGFLTLQQFGVIPDMIYIDAGHDYESVKNDIINWTSILRPGGVLIGDDWHHPPIKCAVKDTIGSVIDRGAKFVWIK